MKNTLLTILAAGLSVTVAGARLGLAQQPKGDHEQHHKQAADSGDTTDMMSMMIEMHQRHMAAGNQWEATEDAVFVLRGGRLLKYDADLNLVKTVDLPKAAATAKPRPEHDDEETEVATGPAKHRKKMRGKMQEKMQRMQGMMARMHSGLTPRIEVTRRAVFVSQGNRLLKYDHDLNLRNQADLPEAKPTMKPMRKQKRAGHGHHGGREE